MSFSIRSILLVAITLLYIKSFAQSDFRKGYMVTNKNDTLYGLIDLVKPKTSAEYCFFKKDSLSEVTTFTPKTIHSYKFNNGKYFVTKRVPITGDNNYYFLEYLVDGKLDLYFLHANTHHNYFIEKEGKLYELSNDEIYERINGKNTVRNSNRYKSILNWLMKDANDLSKDIFTTTYDHRSLIKLTKDYHNQVCEDGQCMIYYKKEKKLNNTKWRINYGVHLGY